MGLLVTALTKETYFRSIHKYIRKYVSQIWNGPSSSVNMVIEIAKLYCDHICFEVLMVWNVFKQNFMKTKELPVWNLTEGIIYKTKLNFWVRFKYWWLLATSYKRSMCFWRKFSEWEEEMQKKGKTFVGRPLDLYSFYYFVTFLFMQLHKC